jgi:hypothetical protein
LNRIFAVVQFANLAVPSLNNVDTGQPHNHAVNEFRLAGSSRMVAGFIS